jgi:hypothetical protein
MSSDHGPQHAISNILYWRGDTMNLLGKITARSALSHADSKEDTVMGTAP